MRRSSAPAVHKPKELVWMAMIGCKSHKMNFIMNLYFSDSVRSCDHIILALCIC